MPDPWVPVLNLEIGHLNSHSSGPLLPRPQHGLGDHRHLLPDSVRGALACLSLCFLESRAGAGKVIVLKKIQWSLGVTFTVCFQHHSPFLCQKNPNA